MALENFQRGKNKRKIFSERKAKLLNLMFKLFCSETVLICNCIKIINPNLAFINPNLALIIPTASL